MDKCSYAVIVPKFDICYEFVQIKISNVGVE